MVLDNDTRGWIMTSVSGVACVLGSSIICIDLIIQTFPGKRNFRIQDSNTFLSASLSLSFGVMLFSALYSMLPSADDYLKKAGLSPQAAAYTLIGCFIGGVVAIQILSRFLHHHIPSHVVDCDHSHDNDFDSVKDSDAFDHHNHSQYGDGDGHKPNGSIETSSQDENTPLLSRSTEDLDNYRPDSSSVSTEHLHHQRPQLQTPQATRRPSLQARLTNQVSSLVSRSKSACDEGGPCYGFSSPCGRECFKNMQQRWVDTRRGNTSNGHRHLGISRSSTAPSGRHLENLPETDDLEDQGGSSENGTASNKVKRYDHSQSGSSTPSNEEENLEDAKHVSSGPHHHHVPQNAFLSIGLQTSIAIALHKLPEGFITFATNHANPKLGFAVFMALFIHNITEGFAMALPLYLALGSRWKAMLWSSLLGGVSQPLGAGVAAIWFKAAGRGDLAPGEGVYGAMFAVTSGIMTSVALQLFSESLEINHSRSICIVFAFLGMAILGISFALTAE